jgi:hypothetical protein
MYLSGLRSLGPAEGVGDYHVDHHRRLSFGSDAVAGDCRNPMPGHLVTSNSCRGRGETASRPSAATIALACVAVLHGLVVDLSFWA